MIVINNDSSIFPNSCTEKNILNGEKTLDFHVIQTKENWFEFEDLEIEALVSLDTEEYIIKEKEMYMTGKRPAKRLFAMHVFFEIANARNDEELTGEIELSDALTYVFNDSGWKYELFGSGFKPIEKETFGNDNKLALFTSILTDWDVEYVLDTPKRIVKIYSKIGNLVDHTFRYNHNIKTMKYTDNSRELKTAIKGYGQPGIVVTYRSPNIDEFNEKWQEPIRDEKYTDPITLLAALKEALKDEPEFTVEIDVTQIGNDYEPVIGDAVLTIHEPLGIDIDTRITETTRYPFNHNKKTQVVLSNISANESLKISNIYKQLSVAKKTNKELLEKYKKVEEKIAEVDTKVESVTTKFKDTEQSQLKVTQNTGKTNTEIKFDKAFTAIPQIQITPTSVVTNLFVQATKTNFKVFSASDLTLTSATFNWMIIYKTND